MRYNHLHPSQRQMRLPPKLLHGLRLLPHLRRMPCRNLLQQHHSLPNLRRIPTFRHGDHQLHLQMQHWLLLQQHSPYKRIML